MVLSGLLEGAGRSLGLHSSSVHCTQLASERGERLGEALRTPLHRSGLERVAKAGADFFTESMQTARAPGEGLVCAPLSSQPNSLGQRVTGKDTVTGRGMGRRANEPRGSSQKFGSEKQATAGNDANSCHHLRDQLLARVWTLRWCVTSSEVSSRLGAVMFRTWQGYSANRGA